MSQTKTIIVFGDSITYGASDLEKSGWVDRLKQWANCLNETGDSYTLVYNLGIPGTNTSDVLSRFEQEAKCRVDPGEDVYLFFAFGANDVAKNRTTGKFVADLKKFSSNIKELVSKAGLISPQINLVNITPVVEKLVNDPTFGEKNRLNDDIDLYNANLKTVCTELGVSMIDVNKEFKKVGYESLLSADGLHPNSSGHKLIYETIEKLFLK